MVGVAIYQHYILCRVHYRDLCLFIIKSVSPGYMNANFTNGRKTVFILAISFHLVRLNWYWIAVECHRFICPLVGVVNFKQRPKINRLATIGGGDENAQLRPVHSKGHWRLHYKHVHLYCTNNMGLCYPVLYCVVCRHA